MKKPWKSSTRKIQKLALLGFVISLVSCKKFDWQPEPWVGDALKNQLVKYTGETMPVSSNEFSKMTCFDAKNIAELKTAIDRVNTSKTKKASDGVFSSLTKRIIKAKLK